MALTAEEQALDFNPELQDVGRQRKLAELLMATGMQQPQGQMISGRYVAPSFTQQLNPLANILAGQAIGERADTKQLELATALRGRQQQEINKFGELLKTNPNKAYQFAAQSQVPQLREVGLKKMMPQEFDLPEGGSRFMTMPDGSVKEIAKGKEKYRAPIQIDTGTYIELRDPNDPTKVISRMPKSQMPTAGQVVETANGPMLVNTRTGQAQPVMGAGGQAIAPKLTSEQSKDITAVNQQRATIDGAIADVEKNKSAFSFGRGVAQNLPYGESIAGRFENTQDTQARAYVFNNVSSVIKERAGTAQSAQELQRLNSFLPATTDNADQIISKLKGFKQYLNDLEKGTRVNPNMPTPQTPQAPQTPKKVVNFNDLP
jgi:hypothetical protein